MYADVQTLSYLTTFVSHFLSTHLTYKTKLTQQLDPVLHIAEVVSSLTVKTSLIMRELVSFSARQYNSSESHAFFSDHFCDILISRGLWTSGSPDVSLCNFFAYEAD